MIDAATAKIFLQGFVCGIWFIAIIIGVSNRLT